MSTIKDIAAAAGVSKSTVSRVLTNTGYVNEETRRRIMSVIEETGYMPSASARTLSTRTSNTIGVVVPEMGNSFFSAVFDGISQVVDEKNLTIVYCNTSESVEKEAKALDTLIGQRVSGMILAPAVDYSRPGTRTRLQKQLEQLNAPVVLVDREIENMHLDSVMYDNYGSAYAGTKALIEAGNRTIGIITGEMNLQIGRDRYNGYAQAMKDFGKEVLEKYVWYGDFEMQTAYDIACRMYDRGDVPDAVLTCNNQTTLGLLRATRERGLRFGRDIAMVGIDHIEVLDIIDYEYSYVTRDMVDMGRQAMKLLLERISHPQMGIRNIIMPYQMNLKGAEKKQKEK